MHTHTQSSDIVAPMTALRNRLNTGCRDMDNQCALGRGWRCLLAWKIKLGSAMVISCCGKHVPNKTLGNADDKYLSTSRTGMRVWQPLLVDPLGPLVRVINSKHWVSSDSLHSACSRNRGANEAPRCFHVMSCWDECGQVPDS